MPPTSGPCPHTLQAKAETTGASKVPFPALVIQQIEKKSLLLMPVEIIANILIEWTMWEWFAPAIARQICRRFKDITDSSPHAWSKLSIALASRATADDVRGWLRRAKQVSKEICIETKDIGIVTAALEGAKDATSLVYRIPMYSNVPPLQQELVLNRPMNRLRRLRLASSNICGVFLGLSHIFGRYGSPCDATFSCLTTLHLVYVNLVNFHIMPGLFPALRRLVLHYSVGPILDLIQVCSGSLEDLRVTLNQSHHRPSHEHDRILLPNLKALFLNSAVGIVSCIEAPALRLIWGDFDEIDRIAVPFHSVVEWASCRQNANITSHLMSMPQLRYLMICKLMKPLGVFFEFLRDNPMICPYLESIEVAESDPRLKLDTQFKEFLKARMASRAEKVPGFTVQFVERHVKVARFARYYTDFVCLFIIIASLLVLPCF